MKKISMLIIAILCCFSALSQQTQIQQNSPIIVPLDDIVSIKLPIGSKKLSKEKLQTIPSNDYKKSAIDTKKGKGDFYENNGTLIQLNSAVGITQENYLEHTKKGFDEIYALSRPKNYTSAIKSFNNYKVLVINFERAGRGTYNFFCVNDKHTKALNGIMEFDSLDKTKAASMLDDMLKSIKFKDN